MAENGSETGDGTKPGDPVDGKPIRAASSHANRGLAGDRCRAPVRRAGPAFIPLQARSLLP